MPIENFNTKRPSHARPARPGCGGCNAEDEMAENPKLRLTQTVKGAG